MMRLLVAAVLGGWLVTSPAHAQTPAADGRPALAPSAIIGPVITTGAGRRYSRFGTTITLGSGRTVGVGRLLAPRRPRSSNTSTSVAAGAGLEAVPEAR